MNKAYLILMTHKRSTLRQLSTFCCDPLFSVYFIILILSFPTVEIDRHGKTGLFRILVNKLRTLGRPGTRTMDIKPRHYLHRLVQT